MPAHDLPTPKFHHVHLRSADPDAAVDFYCRLFPTSRPTTWAGFTAAAVPNDILILFERDETVDATQQSALWHFGWHVPDSRRTTEEFLKRDDVVSMPLYTGIGDGHVPICSDTWYKTGEDLGVTKARIAELQAQNAPIPGGPGFAYFQGPDGALFEIAGDYGEEERFNHVHMWQEDPFCAQLWYRKHFGFQPRAKFANIPVGEDDCRVPRTPDPSFPALDPAGMYRYPAGGVAVGDVDLTWYPNQGSDSPPSSLGRLLDHIAFSVTDLDAWSDRLKSGGVTFLKDAYPIGDTRAVMIEGPSREAIALVEAA